MKAVLFLVVLLSVAVNLPAAPVSVSVDFDRPVVLAGEARRVVVKVGLTADRIANPAKRPPVNLCIVLDHSGSMGGEKLEKAKEGAIAAIRRLDERDYVSLVVYDTTVQTIVESRPAGDLESIIAAIRRIEAGSSTALFGGVSQGAAEVRKRLGTDAVHRIILLSDGLANVGPSSPDDLGRLGASLIKEGISVTTIGLGLDYNEDLMTRLSQKSDGHAYFVKSSDDLPRIFKEELGEVLNVAARQVIIEIECLDGAKPGRILGREGRIEKNRVEIYLNQLYGGQEKYALLEIEVPKGEVGTKREIARVSCRYEDASNHQERKAVKAAGVSYAKTEDEVTRNMTEDVVTALVINTRAIARDRAIDLLDQGKKDEAQKLILTNTGELLEWNESAIQNGWSNKTFILQNVGGQKELSEQLKAQPSMSPSDRKAMRTENYQDLNQQEVR